MTCRRDVQEGGTCDRCENWVETDHTVVLPTGPVVIFQVGLCRGDESDHFGHLVIHEHPACGKFVEKA